MVAQNTFTTYLEQLTAFQSFQPTQPQLHLLLNMHTGLLITSIGTGVVLGRRLPDEPSHVIDLSQYGALDAGISRQHAHIFMGKSGEILVSDLGSANGTFLNETRLRKGTIHQVYQGDILRLGKLFIQVNFCDSISDIWAEWVEKIALYEKKDIVNINMQRINDCLYASIVTEIRQKDIESYWHQLGTLEADKALNNQYSSDRIIITPQLEPLPEEPVIRAMHDVAHDHRETSQARALKLHEVQTHTSYQSPISIVIAHPDKLVQLGIKHLLAVDMGIRIVAMCDTVSDLFELYEKNPRIHITLASTALIDEMTEDQKAVASVLGGRTIAIGTEDHEIVNKDLQLWWGFLTQDQALEHTISCIYTVQQGKPCFDIGQSDYGVKPLDSSNGLTDEEYNALKYLASNYTNAHIASLMGVSSEIIETYRLNIMRKLKFDSKAQLVIFALNHGIISLDKQI